jgi:transposase
MTHGRGKSDPAVVARKSVNKAEQLAAESMEQRAGAKGNVDQQTTCRAQNRAGVSLTAGQAHDCPLAEGLIRRVKPSNCMLGDAAYDSNELCGRLNERGTKPVIPNRCNRKQPFTFNKRLYKLRWRIEAAFNGLKDFRRVATCYDRLARNYLASVCLAAALVWSI